MQKFRVKSQKLSEILKFHFFLEIVILPDLTRKTKRNSLNFLDTGKCNPIVGMFHAAFPPLPDRVPP